MSLKSLSAGPKVPELLHAIIETTPHTGSVKYEMDKDSGLLFVDRFMSTTMAYPCLYGYVPNTLAEDGDPLDVLVLSPDVVLPGAVMLVRPIAVLLMEDEAGMDSKVLTVPCAKACPSMAHMQSLSDVPERTTRAIKHFFEHYKDLEANKWVKVTGWADTAEAIEQVKAAVARV